jgi:hypothetical protein
MANGSMHGVAARHCVYAGPAFARFFTSGNSNGRLLTCSVEKLAVDAVIGFDE